MRFGLALLIFTMISASSFAADGRKSVAPRGRTAATAADDRTAAMLRGLDPATRFEQICDIEAMNRIDKDTSSFHPERAVIDAVSSTKIVADTMEGSGGAFRSAGKWYQFSFTCRTSPDRMKVVDFSYKIGPPIPQEKWEAYGLWR
jgi:hypothetical protein